MDQDASDSVQESLVRIGKILAEMPRVKNSEWIYQGSPILPVTVFSPNGALGLFVQMAEWESEYHRFFECMDFTVAQGISICGLVVIPKSGIENPCYFSLMASTKEVLRRILGASPRDEIVLDDLANMSEDEAIPLSRFTWP